jgi:hypothetical protein
LVDRENMRFVELAALLSRYAAMFVGRVDAVCEQFNGKRAKPVLPDHFNFVIEQPGRVVRAHWAPGQQLPESTFVLRRNL